MHTVTVIPGDGVGPEILQSTCRILDAVDVPLRFEHCEAGSTCFSKGIVSGVPRETLDSITRNQLVLKGPLETPVGSGGKSANVTLRKHFEIFGNIRPVRAIPGIRTPYQGRPIDCVIVRENIEDLYAGIEHMQTATVSQALKIITEKGCEKIVRLAFEIACSEGRKRVHCTTKANILKLTEGLMKRVFERISLEYPQIEAKHLIVDNCAHQLVVAPEQFDVLVCTNLHGDILSDLAAGLVGGLGIAPSANLGMEVALFEAVHGSAPDIAGQNKANPTSLILSSVLLLRHIGAFEAADQIQHALLYTLEEGSIRTGDIVAHGQIPASTTAFTEAILQNLGKRPHTDLPTRTYRPLHMHRAAYVPKPAPQTRTVGLDCFLQTVEAPAELAARLIALSEPTPWLLEMIDSRGTQVYPVRDPTLIPQVDPIDCVRARFTLRPGHIWDEAAVSPFLQALYSVAPWIHIERLLEIDGKPGYTAPQGS